MAEAKEPKTQSFKVKDGAAIKLLVSSRKEKDKGGKKYELYKPGDSVKLTAAQALSHQSELELSDDQLSKLQAEVAPTPVEVFRPEPPKEKK